MGLTVTKQTPNLKVRAGLREIENRMLQMPGVMMGDCFPLKHTFVDGAYVREITMPKGALLTSKIHKITHPYFILKGEVSVLTEEGVVRIKAPYSGVTKAGTKRLLYVHEETVWTTVHVTDKTDLNEIENEIIAKDHTEMDYVFDFFAFRELTKEVIAHEKDGFYSDWTKEEQYQYDFGTWESFSILRGYSKEEIEQFRLWLKMFKEAKTVGLDPYIIIKDLTIKAALKNIAKDTKGEIMKSSHFPKEG